MSNMVAAVIIQMKRSIRKLVNYSKKEEISQRKKKLTIFPRPIGGSFLYV